MLKKAIEFMQRYWHDSIKLWILRKTKFESRKRWWSEKCKPWILQYRTYSLGWASLIGIIFAFVVYWIFCALKNYVLHGSLTILALGLPAFFVLWLFRTNDVRRQIDKTEENTNNSTLFECVKILTAKYPEENIEKNSLSTETVSPPLFTEKNSLSPKTDLPPLHDEVGIPPHILEKSLPTRIALEQLAYLRRGNRFDKKKIDFVTWELKLGKMRLEGARLSGLNFTRADLRGVRLRFADLTNVNLTSSLLDEADLGGADLRGANLTNTDTTKTQFSGAIYDKNTIFNFLLDTEEKRKKASMVFKKTDKQK